MARVWEFVGGVALLCVGVWGIVWHFVRAYKNDGAHD